MNQPAERPPFPLRFVSELEPVPRQFALRTVRQLARDVAQRHATGEIHGNLLVDRVQVDVEGAPILPPGSPRIALAPVGLPSGLPSGLWIPASQGAFDLSSQIEAARGELAAAGMSIDPRQIDVGQLGALLVRLLTGKGGKEYVTRADVRSQIGADLQPLLDRALGMPGARLFADIAEFQNALAAIAEEAALETPETPAAQYEQQTILTSLADAEPEQAGEPTSQVLEIVEDSPSAVNPAEPDVPFKRLGHYKILARLGGGGMGEVYLGFEESLQRKVAIKVLPADLARQPEFIRRFRAEATSAAKLIHPHVVQIHFIGEDDGHHFFGMQYVQGLPLSQHIRRCGKLSVGETLLVTEQVLEGLAAAHELGLVHRDIKPGNILLDQTSSRALLADFGLVKSLEGSHSMATSRGTILGTAEYLSPEQGLGEEVDGRSDLYSVGVMMFQMLTGQVPFRGNSMTAMIYQHVHERPPKLAKVAPELPRALTAIVERLLKKHPDERFQTAHEVLDALREIPDERCWSCGSGSDAPQPVSVRRPTGAGRSSRSVIVRSPATGRRVLIGAGLGLVLCAIVLGVWRPWTDSKSGSTGELTGDPSTQDNGSNEKTGSTTTGRNQEEAETAPTEWTGPKGIRRLAGHTQSMVALAVSLDGTRLLSGDVTGKLRVWNAGTDELVATIDGSEFGVALRRATFTEDGQTVITCWNDPVIRLWDASTGALARSLHGHTQAVSEARPVPGTTWIVSSSMDISLRVWDLKTGETNLTFGAAKNEVKLPPVPTAEDLAKLDGHIAWIRDVVPLANGRQAISAGNDAVLFLWDLHTGALVDRLVSHNGNVFNLIPSADGKLLFSIADDHRIRLWDVAERKAIMGLPYQDSTARPALAIATTVPLGAVGGEDRVIKLYDLTKDREIVESLPIGPQRVTSLVFSLDDQWLWAGYDNGTLVAWPAGDVVRRVAP